ncbi:MAG: C1 family peptidase [Bacteroidales bacterium]|nr:C1 family peptidase [Bacteroidales bacterium]MCF8352229.1 C1 family peptidase [Bacteroidales bacterium]MCF8375715.1 C1 family peptidase [Bacteroidales bacterium]MCF8400315.1 C1 family peptidase [Bacteroidales bacterium]
MKNKFKMLVVATALIFAAYNGKAQEGAITPEVLSDIKQSVWDEPDDRALINAVSNNDIKKLALNRENVGKVNHYFSHKVETTGITDQKSTGRCWLFTGLNILKPIVLEKLDTKEFEFSQNYNFFWDQLEKSNLFLEAIISTTDKPEDDRTVDWIFKHPIQDGGQWTTFADVVKKYGLVPKSAMPETHQSENTRSVRSLIAKKLRGNAIELRQMFSEGKTKEELREEKITMLSDIYRILVLSFGQPPQEFEWQYKTTDGNITEVKSYTPLEFYNEYVGIDLDEYVMFMNDPSREYGKLYEIEYDRSMVEGYNWNYINLKNEKIKAFAKTSILDKQAMYFSCDVGKQLNRDEGTLDVKNYAYNDLMGVNFDMNKANRIKTYQSASTHGMALIGLNIDQKGAIDKWLLENSWGAKSGNKGYLTMTDEWFDEYMFRVVINKKYVDEETLKILEQEPIKLPPWDPMFAFEE